MGERGITQKDIKKIKKFGKVLIGCSFNPPN